MEIKNFLSTQKRNIGKKAFWRLEPCSRAVLLRLPLVVLFMASAFIGCSTHSKKVDSTTLGAPNASATQQTNSDARTSSPPNRSRETPKIGIILGPGGLKTFAHIGVLRELEKARIPIHSIVGIEWGALMGGLYSIKAKSNDVEWKMLKLKKEDLPSPTIFRSDTEPKDISIIEDFMREVFENKNVGDAEIMFSCPFTTIDSDRLSWVRSGSLKEGVLSCLPFPPIYKPYRDNVAGIFEVRAAAKKLRDSGAEVVILVNVLAQGEVFKSKKTNAGYETQLLWTQVKSRLSQDQDAVDFVIGVHTRDYDIMNYDARRSMILFGSQSGMIAVKKLSETYGL